ncbi:5-deoxy-glucuronate isomerase [Photobacterium sp. OFAV2-7]|uniref:5-deoxy-glucuronate isomerase n=1 Tax=Photobacterium sp. OFAV2-7 TaxID=2917748 RepID=UPI001EF5E730|nr:5-deoxy-glucuronate isomerase [Photobacterium sp. OFAV2-7]MCG7588502.1 5-deoxy-glucuronate isomerase [Photobacterium sp. OFAV2-7]
MGKHIPPFDNKNQPIVDINDDVTPLCYFNQVRLSQGETHSHYVEGYESVIVLAGGTCSIKVSKNSAEESEEAITFDNIGQRASVWDGNPESVYVPLGYTAEIECVSENADIMIAGGRFEESLEPFCIRQDNVDIVQYGSDETKTHRKIKHVLGQSNADKRGRLLVSELFTVGVGGWSGFPPHKHDEDRIKEDGSKETLYEEVYQFRFNPDFGFGAQFLYEHEDDFGPVYHVRTGSVIAIDKGYHPSVAAPGYEMYYFTIIVGKTSKSLIQHFDPHHEYQVETIPGIKDMIAKFK